jgi:hypothetical protein
VNHRAKSAFNTTLKKSRSGFVFGQKVLRALFRFARIPPLVAVDCGILFHLSVY